MTAMRTFSFFLCLLFTTLWSSSAQMSENDRLEEYYARNYTWPLPEVVPNTPGWRRIMDRRLAQIEEMEGSHDRYEGFIQTLISCLVAPNFTENGWGLTHVNEDLLRDLQQGIRDGLPDAVPEKKIQVIEADEPPLFIYRKDLTDRVLKELHPLHEAWAGLELVPHQAYGFRLYGNNSRLFMHVDKSQTHVISGILHIDRSEDAEPWPILIEDYQGNLNEVLLEPGDLLFYESSKCWHGRPKRFKGSWYTSVFLHFYPKGDWRDRDSKSEGHYAVPPHWSEEPTSSEQDRLQMSGTSMLEPDCEHVWCGLKDSVKWSGPGVEGEVLTTNNHRFKLEHFNDEL